MRRRWDSFALHVSPFFKLLSKYINFYQLKFTKVSLNNENNGDLTNAAAAAFQLQAGALSGT